MALATADTAAATAAVLADANNNGRRLIELVRRTEQPVRAPGPTLLSFAALVDDGSSWWPERWELECRRCRGRRRHGSIGKMNISS